MKVNYYEMQRELIGIKTNSIIPENIKKYKNTLNLYDFLNTT